MKKTHDISTQTDEEKDFNITVKIPKKRKYSLRDADYFRRLTKRRKDIYTSIENALDDCDSDVPIRFRILDSLMENKTKSILIKKLDKIANVDPCESEYIKIMNYIEAVCRLPLGVYKTLPYTSNSDKSDISDFLSNVKSKLDNVVFGHEDCKNQIVRLLAQWISNPKSEGLVIGIEGPPGSGKTSLVKQGICKLLDLPFGFIPLGGVSDSSYLSGHSFTYVGSRWGRIADVLMECKCMNPILFFDELDKVSNTRYGEEIINTLIHLTDSSQNTHFHDKYFSDAVFNLSKCLVVFSYNDANLINPILRDRMVTIRVEGYKSEDKIEIASKYLLRDLKIKFGFKDEDIYISKDVIKYIIEKTPEESGVRNLKRSLEEVISNINYLLLCKTEDLPLQIPISISKSHVDKFLKICRVKYLDNPSLSHIYI